MFLPRPSPPQLICLQLSTISYDVKGRCMKCICLYLVLYLEPHSFHQNTKPHHPQDHQMPDFQSVKSVTAFTHNCLTAVLSVLAAGYGVWSAGSGLLGIVFKSYSYLSEDDQTTSYHSQCCAWFYPRTSPSATTEHPIVAHDPLNSFQNRYIWVNNCVGVFTIWGSLVCPTFLISSPSLHIMIHSGSSSFVNKYISFFSDGIIVWWRR